MVVLGNRGECAQPCRLPYSLYENETILDKGYLLSPRDNFGVSFLPELIKAGIDSFKIEGRMKTPEYVGVVTRFYRKYINLILENQNQDIGSIKKLINSELEIKNPETLLSDKEEITQVFNRGGFSAGHFENKANHNLICKEKPNNMGIYVGNIMNFNPNKGYIKLKLENDLSIGDRISINDENYTISELMINNENISTSEKGAIVTIGRMKGKILKGQKIFRISASKLTKNISPTFSEEKEFKKIPLNGELMIKLNSPISLKIWSDSGIYKNLEFIAKSDIIPQKALKQPVSKEKIFEQINKTGNTCYEFTNLNIILDNNLFLPVKALNELRRTAINGLENLVINKFTHNLEFKKLNTLDNQPKEENQNISILLNIFKPEFEYAKLKNVNRFYIPLNYFIETKFEDAIKKLSFEKSIYLYMPSVLKDKKLNLINFENILEKFNIKGFVVSHISQVEILKKYNLELIGNFTLNIYNNFSVDFLKSLKLNTITPSVELSNYELNNFAQNSSINSEIIVYGKIPVMTNNYCYLGKSNKCYKECEQKCKTNNMFYLEDRLGCKFRILPLPIFGTTTIFNFKPINLDIKSLKSNFYRVDILDESFAEIQNIIDNYF